MIPGTNSHAPDHDDPLELLNLDGIRVDILPEYSDPDLDIIVSRLAHRPHLRPLFIPRTMEADPPALVRRARWVYERCKRGIPQVFDMEIGNEPDLVDMAGEWSTRPELFGDACEWVHNDLRDRGFEGHLYTGGVTGLGPRGMNYLQGMKFERFPDTLWAAWHVYGTFGLLDPPKGNSSWLEASTRAKHIVGEGRPFAVTEFGEHTAVYNLPWAYVLRTYLETGQWVRTRQLTEREVGEMLIAMMAFWEGQGAVAMYQFAFKDAKTGLPWGLVDADGAVKLQGTMVQEWIEMREAA